MGCEFVGSVCYADDLALLDPLPSALRLLLNVCEDFARLRGLKFNATKTLNLANLPALFYDEVFLFCGARLEFSKKVTHLGNSY